jgi:eukaryotic translation initiation factor 2-alpha kinase 4
MPPTNPWGKKPPQRNTASSEFPDLKPSKSNDAVPKSPAPKSQYEEIQEDELIALASIYGEDFQKIDSNLGAWKVCCFSSALENS